MAIFKKTNVTNRNNFIGSNATCVTSEVLDRTWTRFDFGIQWLGADGGVTDPSPGQGTGVGLVEDPATNFLNASPSWTNGPAVGFPIWIKWELGTRPGTIKESFYNYTTLRATRDNVDPGFGTIHIQDSDPPDSGRPGPRYTIALAGTEYRVYAGRGAGFGDKPYVSFSAPRLTGFPFPMGLAMAARTNFAVRNVIAGAGTIPTTIYSKAQQIEDFKILVTVDNTTDIFTATAHGLVDTTAIWIDAVTLPGGLTAGTLYFVRDATANTFKVAATSGGTAINITSNGSGVLVAPRQGALNLRIYQIGRYAGIDGLPTDISTPSLL